MPINTTESRFAACLKRLLQQNLPRPEVGHIYSNASATNSFLAKRRCGYALVLMRRGGRRRAHGRARIFLYQYAALHMTPPS